MAYTATQDPRWHIPDENEWNPRKAGFNEMLVKDRMTEDAKVHAAKFSFVGVIRLTDNISPEGWYNIWPLS